MVNKTEKFEEFFLRLCLVLYVIIANAAIVIFWFSGLKIDYINAARLPYKKIQTAFINPYVII